MVSTALGLTAASWAVLMALSPILQIREIMRRHSGGNLDRLLRRAAHRLRVVGFLRHRESRPATRRPELRRVPGYGLHDRRRS
jgi:hypothetical protein